MTEQVYDPGLVTAGDAERLAVVLARIAGIDPSHEPTELPVQAVDWHPDDDYAERNRLILLAMALARACGMEAGIGVDLTHPRPVVAYIELPTGQVSWHQPGHRWAWDGHDTAEKYRRIAAYTTGGA